MTDSLYNTISIEANNDKIIIFFIIISLLLIFVIKYLVEKNKPIKRYYKPVTPPSKSANIKSYAHEQTKKQIIHEQVIQYKQNTSNKNTIITKTEPLTPELNIRKDTEILSKISTENNEINYDKNKKNHIPGSSNIETQNIRIIIPQNPKITFINAQDEQQNKIKFIGYEPVMKLEQRAPYSYPMVFMPKRKSVIKFPRKGRQGTKGYTEDLFKSFLLINFKNTLQIFDDRFVLHKENQNPYEPDFSLIDEKNGLNLFIDIEIDEPYDSISRQPTHCIGDNKQRDTFFKNRGWIVIRFAEIQIFKEPLKCCKLISQVIKSVNSTFLIKEQLASIDDLLPIKQWDKSQALLWAKTNYREDYLGSPKFKKQQHIKILQNLYESEIGALIEQQVEEEDTNCIKYKTNLILQSIKNNSYFSCKVPNYYTVFKPSLINENTVSGFCFVKNKQTTYPISDLKDIILKEKPFVLRVNGAVGTTEMKSIISKYIDSKNPIRLKYTKSTFGSLTVDVITGEIILSDNDRDSLRTITGFDVVSKLISKEQINEYKLNDIEYIAGFCNLRNAIRNFKYERINELEILDI